MTRRRLKKREKKEEEEEDDKDESGYGVISCMMCYMIIQQQSHLDSFPLPKWRLGQVIPISLQPREIM